ncbi:MAG: glycosyltransferase family 4 protein [Thiolinea sp.]
MSHIAIFIGDLGTPGGAERVAHDLGRELVVRGHALTVVTFENKDKAAYLPVPGRHLHIDAPSGPGHVLQQLFILLRRAWLFRRLIRREGFDQVFAFLETANVPCALAHRDAVLSVHLDPDKWSPRQQQLVRRIFPRARRVIAVSAQMRQCLEQRFGLKNVLEIINPVDTRQLQLQARAEPDHQLVDQPFIVAVGRLTAQKRFDRLIRCYAQAGLAQRYRLLILGEGEERDALQQLITDLQLTERIRLPGLETNPWRYMARAVFLVMSSDFEGYPLTLIEALALGCPVIALDCPTGPREIVRHEQNGLLVPVGDDRELATALQRLADDEGLRSRLAQAAPASVERNDIRRVTDAWLAA